MIIVGMILTMVVGSIISVCLSEYKMKDIYKKDKEVGCRYRGYINLKTGNIKVLPSRISAEYMKNAHGMTRYPKLDFVVGD